MNYLRSPSVWLLLAIVFVALFVGPLFAFVFAGLLVLIKAIQWINTYRKNQKDYRNELEQQLEILKYKNTKNKKKGTNHDHQS